MGKGIERTIYRNKERVYKRTNTEDLLGETTNKG